MERAFSQRAWLSAIWAMFAVLFIGNAGWTQVVVGPGKVFIRFTNLRADNAGVLIRLKVVPNYNKTFPWMRKTIYVGSQGQADKAGGRESYLKKGQPSPWIDIGPYMNVRGARSPDTYLSPVLCGVMTESQKDGLHLKVEIAIGEQKAILRRLEVEKPELKAIGEWQYPWMLGYGTRTHLPPFLPTVGLLVPSRPDLTVRVFTLEEALRWQLDFIEKFPNWGRTPEKFIFTTRGRPEVLKALGYNDWPESMVVGNLGDEIFLKLATPEDEQNIRFRAELQNRGFRPIDLLSDENAAKAKTLPIAAQWALVTVLPALPDKPKHFFESADFRYRLWYEELATRRIQIEKKNAGKTVLTGANFSSHMNVWPDVRQWIMPFRTGAMTMSWTEDWWWQLKEISPQGYGYLLSAFRLARTYNGAPIQYYVMPFKGNSTVNFRKMHHLALAQGVTIFNHFHTEDQVLTTWDYISFEDSPAMYRAIYDIIHAYGAVEHRLFDAAPAKAQVAILISRAGDTWDTEDLGGAGRLYGAKYNVNNEERKSLYLALRHAQIPVDLITDDDVIEGKLTRYKVLYLAGSEIMRQAAEPIANWVRNGGVLYGSGGGGMWDQYRQPNENLKSLYGIQEQKLNRQERFLRPRKQLPTKQPLDILAIEGKRGFSSGNVQIEALMYRDTLIPIAGVNEVVRYSRSKDVGLIVHAVSKGTTIYSGALAGLAYVKPAATANVQILPTQFDQNVRDFILEPIRRAGIVAPVTSSDPLVDVTLMEGKNGRAVILTNWRDQPIKELTLDFPGLQGIKSIRSLASAGKFEGDFNENQRGTLPIKVTDGVTQVRMPLDVTDVLYLD